MWFNLLLILALLSKSKEVVGDNNDAEPLMMSNLTHPNSDSSYSLYKGWWD